MHVIHRFGYKNTEINVIKWEKQQNTNAVGKTVACPKMQKGLQ